MLARVALLSLGAVGLAGAIGAPLASQPVPMEDALSAADVSAIVRTAVGSLNDPSLAAAVVDRAGSILAVYARQGASPFAPDQAVSLARTGAFFSNDHAPLSSRTVRFISGIHFPPGIPNTANAALYGIENTNRGCSAGTVDAAFTALPRPRSWQAASAGLSCDPSDTRGCSLGITTGKADLRDTGVFDATVNPGGMPLYRNGRLLGGVGV